MGFSRLRKRLPSCEALVERVPEGDFVLAQPPAEEHLLVPAPSRKIDEALIEILDENAERLQFLDAVHDAFGLGLDRLLQRVHLMRPDAAAVPGDLGRDPAMTDRGNRERTPMRDHALGEQANRREQLICLFRREVAIRHGYIFDAWSDSRSSTP
jgi:hypothetical protein